MKIKLHYQKPKLEAKFCITHNLITRKGLRKLSRHLQLDGESLQETMERVSSADTIDVPNDVLIIWNTGNQKKPGTSKFITFKELLEEKDIGKLVKIAEYNGISLSINKDQLLASIKAWALNQNFHGMIPVPDVVALAQEHT